MNESLFNELWSLQDTAYDLMMEYDSIPHLYGSELMYHTEGQIIDIIAENPGITCSEIAGITKKTPSACSQLIRKLRKRECVEQTRNETNNRIYNLDVTEKGRKIYESRKVFTENCMTIMKEMLGCFTEEQIRWHVEVQKKINEAYRDDIRRCRA